MGWWTNTEYQALSGKLDLISTQLNNVNANIRAVLNQGTKIMAKADDVRALITKLRTDVADQTTVIGGVGTLLGNLSKIIADLKEKVANADNIPQDIADSIDAVDQAVNEGKGVLAKDVAANTPPAA